MAHSHHRPSGPRRGVWRGRKMRKGGMLPVAKKTARK